MILYLNFGKVNKYNIFVKLQMVMFCLMGAVFVLSLQGEKNTGFDVLYHNMKHGQLATKELAEYVRER